MQKILDRMIAACIGLAMLAGVIAPSFAFAQTASTTSSVTIDQITALLKQVQDLQNQINSLHTQQTQLVGQINDSFEFLHDLKNGTSSDDVRELQEVLATDPSVFPEGLVTGKFGPLTLKAVKKFQKNHGLEAVGTVGPKTRALLNQLLAGAGVGKDGHIPPGLLIAPGIWKKLGGFATSTLSSTTLMNLPPGIAKKLEGNWNDEHHGGDTQGTTTATTTLDLTAPLLYSLGVSNITTTQAFINWTTNENAQASVWYGTTTPLTSSNSMLMSNASFATAHAFTLSGLTASTTYYYKVSSTDAAGNTATSNTFDFSTNIN